MKKLFAVSLTLILVTVFAAAHDGSPGLRHQHQFIVKTDFVQVDFVKVPRGTYYVASTYGVELGQMILNAEYQEWRMPIQNDPYRYRSQKWIRDNNISVKPDNSVFHDLTQGRLNPVKLC